MPPCDVDDAAVDHLMATARFHARVRLVFYDTEDYLLTDDHSQTRKYPLAKCAFFGTECSDAIVVPVAVEVDRAEKNPGRPYHLMFRTYVNTSNIRHAIAFNMDQFMIEVEDWPANRETPGEWMWTIFVSRYVSPLSLDAAM